MAVAAVTASPGDARTIFYTGNDLKEWVDADNRAEYGNASQNDYDDIFFLQGFIAGVYDS